MGGEAATTALVGGDDGGMDDGGDIDVAMSSEVMSTDGERGLFSTEDRELGEGESSGAGGGGRMK